MDLEFSSGSRNKAAAEDTSLQHRRTGSTCHGPSLNGSQSHPPAAFQTPRFGPVRRASSTPPAMQRSPRCLEEALRGCPAHSPAPRSLSASIKLSRVSFLRGLLQVDRRIALSEAAEEAEREQHQQQAEAGGGAQHGQRIRSKALYGGGIHGSYKLRTKIINQLCRRSPRSASWPASCFSELKMTALSSEDGAGLVAGSTLRMASSNLASDRLQIPGLSPATHPRAALL